MSKDILINKIYNFWIDYGVLDYEGQLEDLREEIRENIENSYINIEIAHLKEALLNWDENTQEYKDIINLLKELEDFKNEIK